MPKQIDIEKQKEILNDIFIILEITDDNKSFSLKNMDIDLEKQQKILNLENKIKEAFCYSSWTCFKKKTNRRWLSFIKYITKEMNVKLLITRKSIKINEGKYICDTIYNFN